MCGWCGRAIDGGAPDPGVAEPVGDEPTGEPGTPADPSAENPVAGPAEPAVGAGVDASVELPSGTTLLGRYRIDALLGRGGFGITYRARDTRLHRDIAIKELFPPAARRRGAAVGVAEDDRAAYEQARARFQREAATLARFSHPGIVRIFEVFEANNTAYLVMELIEGSSVGELLMERGRPFDVDEVLDLVLRVGDALGAVHGAGLLHRDINPSNLMLDGARRVVLIDFGLARRFGDDISGSVTRAVTPGYAPPEQYAGSARMGPPCDVFGLAATAYKLLTGTTPTNVFDRQTGTRLPAPDELRPEVPPLVSAAILDGMELDPDHRPATTEAFLNRLGLHGMTGAPEVVLSRGSGGDPDATRGGGGASPAPGAGAGAAPGVAAHGGPMPVAPAGARPVAAAPLPAAPAQPGPVHAGPVHAGPVHAVPAPVAAAPQWGAPPPAHFAPWHDGAPPVVAPADTWRGWVTWPAAAAAVVLASASPLVVGAVLALVVVPLLATLGDLEVHDHRRRTGAQRRRWHDARPAVVGPVRYVRNLLVSAARALPAVAIVAIGFAVETVTRDAVFEPALRELVIRTTGVAMALVLLVPIRHASRGFRTDLGITAVARRVMEGRRRPGTRAFVLWVLAVAACALGALLGAELWPLT